MRHRPIAVALGGGRLRRAPFCATLTRDISTPYDEHEFDIEDTLEVLNNKPFHTLAAIGRDPDIQSEGFWERHGLLPNDDYVEVEWTPWDDDGREARDWLLVKRCDGKWLSFAEAVRLDRALLGRDATTRYNYGGLRPQDRDGYNMKLMQLSQKAIP